VPTARKEQPRLIQILLIAGGASELDEPEFDLRMAADRSDAAVAEGLAHMIGGAPSDLDKLVLDAGPDPGDRSLEQVTDVVELMPPLEVGVSRRLA
jgi:hypothetical protein